MLIGDDRLFDPTIEEIRLSGIKLCSRYSRILAAS